jgi:uncharacterized protein YcbK (DUF882 family)
MASKINLGYKLVDFSEYLFKIRKMLNIIDEFFDDWYNRTINITSWYRSVAHNKSVGGASQSKHLDGLAIDFNYPTEYYTANVIRQIEIRQNIKNKCLELSERFDECFGLIFYDDRNCIHMDWCARNANYIEDKNE